VWRQEGEKRMVYRTRHRMRPRAAQV